MKLPFSLFGRTGCFACAIGLLGCFGLLETAEAGETDETPAASSKLPLLEAEMLAQSGSPAKAIRAVDRILRDRERMDLWEEALTRKLRWLANSGQSSRAVKEAKQAARSIEFSGMSHELGWWLVILYAGPEENLRRAIREAESLSRGPRDNEYVERGTYTLGIMHRWDGQPRRAIGALEDYLARYGGGGRFSGAARTALTELKGEK